MVQHVTYLLELKCRVPRKVTSLADNEWCYVDSRLSEEIRSQMLWHPSSTPLSPSQSFSLLKHLWASLSQRQWPLTSDNHKDLPPCMKTGMDYHYYGCVVMKSTEALIPDLTPLSLLWWTGSLGLEYFWETIRGLTGTPPTLLNVAALCHLTAVPIFLPYPDGAARWKQKGSQEDLNIALRFHTICPFHEQTDGRGGNTSPHYKHAPAYFKVTCKSRHLQGGSQRDSTRYCEFASFWTAPNDCTALDRIMCVKPYKQCLVLTLLGIVTIKWSPMWKPL